MQWRHTVRQLSAYVPGESSAQLQQEFGLSKVIKLDSNENPLGPSPLAVRAMQRELGNANAYPDSPPIELHHRIAKQHDISPDAVLVANGADNVISIICASFLNPLDEVVYCAPTFASYRLRTLLVGAVPVECPLDETLCFDLDAIAARVTDRTKLVFLCNPNNPTGTLLPSAAIRDFLESLPSHVIVVLDEAYIDFVNEPGQTGADFVKAGYAVIAVRTFSKLYGLAGLRIGYALACPDLLAPMHTVREPFAANRMAVAGAIAALDDSAFAMDVRYAVTDGMAYLAEAAKTCGITLLPSRANFALLDLHQDASRVCAELRTRGILVRPGAGWGLPTSVRVTIGTRSQLKTLMTALHEILICYDK